MSTTQAPLIGLTTYRQLASFGPWHTEAAVLPATFVRSVERAGGQPLLIPPWSDDDPDAQPDIDLILSKLHGLILTGGGDVDPARYGAEAHPETSGISHPRDELEIALVRGAAEAGLPVLGICRGIEVINVAFEGDLVQHLPDTVRQDGTAPQTELQPGTLDEPQTAASNKLGCRDDIHRGGPGVFADHAVRISNGSLLSQILGESHHVRSYHHQGLGRLGRNMRPVAVAEDSTVEAIESTDHSFLLGVLWHPEEEDSLLLFEELVARAVRYRNGIEQRNETWDNDWKERR